LAIFCSESFLGISEALEFRLYASTGTMVDPLAVPFYAFAILVFYALLFNRVALTTGASLIGALIMAVASFDILGGTLGASLHMAQYFLLAILLGFGGARLIYQLLRRDWVYGTELEAEIVVRRRAEEEAHLANQVKDRFLATMSHELRTPLQGILGMANLLQSNLKGQDFERARTIEVSGKVLLDLINNVLDVVRARRDEEVLSEDTFDLHGLLRETVSLLEVQGGANAAPLNLSIASDVPQWLHGDGARIRRVLFNLISNALKYGGGKPVSVAVRRNHKEKNGDRCVIDFVVADQGPGISQEDQQHIFDEFVRLESGAKSQPGIGLGLAITKRLAGLLGGEIRVESQWGEGTRFHFTVPLAAAEPLKKERRTPRRADAARALDVLLVEDLEINRQVAIGFLEEAGHRVTTAETGRDAIARASAQDFDLILMDIALPDISGIEATRAIRALSDGLRSSVPILALTANVFPDDQARYKAAGMNAVLVKPLDPADLDLALAGAMIEPSSQPEERCVLDVGFLRNERNILGEEILSELVMEFRRQSEALLHSLKQALQAEDLHTVSRGAHRLAGLSSNFGLMDLLRHCQDTERHARTNDLQSTTDLVDVLPLKFAESFDALTAELGELQEVSVNHGRIGAMPTSTPHLPRPAGRPI